VWTEDLTEEVKLRFYISPAYVEWTGSSVAKYQMQMDISTNKVVFGGFYMKPG